MDKQTALPDHEMTKRLEQALTAGSDALFQIILDQNHDVLATTLRNQHLSEDHLLVMLKRRDLTEDLVDRIYRKFNRQISHKIVLALVKNPSTTDFTVRKLLPQLRLFELLDICFLPGATADRRLAAERTLQQRLPTTPLGSKITLARRATSNLAAELLKEGLPQLIEPCLGNPHLREAAIYQFLTGPKATAESISIVARHSRWKNRPNLKLAILKNPRTPAIWHTLWLPKLPLSILRQLKANLNLSPKNRKLIIEELKRRGVS